MALTALQRTYNMNGKSLNFSLHKTFLILRSIGSISIEYRNEDRKVQIHVRVNIIDMNKKNIHNKKKFYIIS